MRPEFARLLKKIESHFVIVRSDLDYGNPAWTIYFADLTRFRIMVSARTPIIFPSEGVVFTPNLIRDLLIELHRIKEISGNTIYVLLTDQADLTEMLASLDGSAFDLAIFTSTEIDLLLESNSFPHDLLSYIRNKIPLGTLSPYRSTGAATGSMFFGREAEIRRIIKNSQTSYAIWGMRKIGKTSLLKEIIRRLSYDRGVTERELIFLDCGPITEPQDYIYRVVHNLLGSQQADRANSKSFLDILRSYTHDGKKPVIFILDEVDALIDADVRNGRPLQKLMRASFNSGYCRYVISGFRASKNDRYNIESPLFNFVDDIMLGPITPREASELITLPMSDLGVKLVGRESIVPQIYQETGGRPHLIQYYCSELLELMDTSGKNEILTSDIEEIKLNSSLQSLLFETFNENASDLERLIIMITLEDDAFSLKDIDLKLRKELGIVVASAEIQSALNYLQNTGTISSADANVNRYKLTYPQLKNIMQKNFYDRKYLINKAKNELVINTKLRFPRLGI